MFKGEDYERFMERITMAEKNRENSEVFLKFNYIIDLVKTPTSKIEKN